MKIIGRDNDGEPIWELTSEEYHQRKSNGDPQSGAAATGPESTPPPAEGESAQATDDTTAQSPQALELGSKIWEMRKAGLTRYEVHRRLGIPMQAVNEILEQFQQSFFPDVGRALGYYAALDDERLEDLLKVWMPVALGGPIEVMKVDKHGIVYSELDTETPVKAAAIVLQAIRGRIQLLSACRPESVGSGNGAGTNILVWLQNVLPGVQKIVQELDGDTVASAR